MDDITVVVMLYFMCLKSSNVFARRSANEVAYSSTTRRASTSFLCRFCRCSFEVKAFACWYDRYEIQEILRWYSHCRFSSHPLEKHSSFGKSSICTLLKFNSSPLKIGLPKRKGLSSNHHFPGAMLTTYLKKVLPRNRNGSRKTLVIQGRSLPRVPPGKFSAENPRIQITNCRATRHHPAHQHGPSNVTNQPTKQKVIGK